jgi:hypothetical protein
MLKLNEWITEVKANNSEIKDFVTKLEGFISDTGFNSSKFEKAVEIGLKNKEEAVKKTFIADAEN